MVLKEGLSHPLTLYPASLAILGGLAAFLFASPAMAVAALGLGAFGAASAVVNCFFRDRTLADRYLKKLAQKQNRYEQRVLDSLKQQLADCGTLPHVSPQAARGLEQFERSRLKYQNVRDLLAEKFSSGELTYGRFLSAARQVYLGVLDNLKRMASLLQSAGTIDRNYITRRIADLDGKQRRKSQRKEKEALIKRLKLLDEQLEQVDALLAANENAMTSLEDATRRIADLDTNGNLATTDYAVAIDYLQELAGSSQEISADTRKTQEVET